MQNQWAPFYAERGCGQAKNVAAGQKLRDLVNAAPNARMQVRPGCRYVHFGRSKLR